MRSLNSLKRRHFLGMLAAMPIGAALAQPSLMSLGPNPPSDVRALVFDMQGTVLDFYTPLMEGVAEIGLPNAQFSDLPANWSAAAREITLDIAAGRRPWAPIGAILSEVFDDVLNRSHPGLLLSPAQKAKLMSKWGQMAPWPDALPAMTALKKAFTVAVLSNASTAGVKSIVERTGLPFDAILTGEMVHSYKPDAKVYQLAVDRLGLKPEQIMMIAAHKWDLYAAKQSGFQTAYVPRPRETGPATKLDLNPEPYIDLIATDFLALSAKLLPADGQRR